MRKILVFAAICALAHTQAFAQGDLMDELEKETKPTVKEPVNFTFKATRLINSSTVENLADGVLDVRISHRFGNLNQGAENFFGIDQANTRLGVDYGITKYLMVGIGHNVLGKENDGFAKVQLIRQKKDGTPVSVSYLGGMSVQTAEQAPTPNGDDYKYTDRLCYFHQVLVARKFNDRLSLQLMPSLLHMNIVDSSKYTNDIISLGVAGRIKLSRRVAFTGEYFYRFTGTDNNVGSLKTYNSLSLGFDIETGGHVFQLHFTNSPGVSERVILGQTTNTWTKGEMRYGFNISRVFTIKKPKEFKKKA